MAETRGTMREELYAHGHEYLTQEPGRGNRFVQQGVQKVVGEFTFPFRETDQVIASGARIPGLGQISFVLNSDGAPCDPRRRDEMYDARRELATGGVASYYYLQGQDVVHSWPVDSELTVVHFSLACWLSSADDTTRLVEAISDGDAPLIPSAWVHLAMIWSRRQAKADVDNAEMVGALDVEFWAGMETMRATLINTQVDEPTFVELTEEQV